MKKFTQILGLTLCWLVLSAAAQGAPRLIIDSADFNFGFVPQNSKISHIFWLKSAGDDSLKILKVVPG
ncbi:MAG: hypothetical protein JSU65_04975 [Candidatus Zixiibacteriota bacterium]|nr:MAG: hypothetical protein JSU65_04975 [candidate division Zixibacteria bacterium]